ncbi:MAG: FIST C-terminal domain-containing protein [Betaproteobacteria bacterium]|nr:FIST C-terminal domain-containing protein [Betaproteobacteria bacterium]MBP6645301.1 FIST C-terminal domain-containing protein [Burkholderiaceae bacterium]
MRLLPLDPVTIAQTLTEWQASYPQMGVMALLPEAEKGQLPILQTCCRQFGVPLIGAIFPALVTAQGFRSDGVWLFRFDTMVPRFLLPDIATSGLDAADRLADATRGLLAQQGADSAKFTLYLMFDGLIPTIASIIDGLYLRLADLVEYAGVNAGSETFQPMPCLFDADRLIGDGVLGMLLPAAQATALQHGYPAPERVMTATATEGNRVLSIDWQPAFDAYQAIIKTEYGIDLTRGNFYQYAVHFPFGILRASDDVVVRIPVALTDDGSLFCVGEVPENAILVLLRAPAAGTGNCLTLLADMLQTLNGPLLGRNLLTFYCAGRRMHMGDEAATELAALHTHSGVAAMGGALSLGEIGSTSSWGYPMFHNAALVCTPWPKE